MSYIGPLFVVSYLMAENSKFVKFQHQPGVGVLRCGACSENALGTIVVAAFVPAMVSQRCGMGMMYGFGGVGTVVNIVMLAIVVLAVFAIVRAAQGEQWECPSLVSGHARSVYSFVAG